MTNFDGDEEKLKLLPLIKKPRDLAGLSVDDLPILAREIRQTIISTVSRTGGHLASSLGVVELTIALLRVFNLDRDKLVWDVGHQTYAHKLLTGRQERFNTLRALDGISGFPKPSESIYDHFGVGHSGTSISAATGMSVAFNLEEAGLKKKVVAVIGDGSMTSGMAYEALNHIGGLRLPLLIVLNDNEMSISENVGALSLFLSRKLSHPSFMRVKKELISRMRDMPFAREMGKILKRSEESFKSFFTPGMLFESLRLTYVGPVDGHNISELINVLEQTREIESPVLLHVLTKKGQGYSPAEKNPTLYHGVGSFDPDAGCIEGAEILKTKNEEDAPKDLVPKPCTFSQAFGKALCELASQNSRIVAITAAMPEGTGLGEFSRRFPTRFFDVGICEPHAVTFAAGLASSGYLPVVAIYSTFLQRAYDQIIHDVCLQNLPVVFCLDRSGLVGEDGPTHHGAFDLSYLRPMPNMTVMAPADEKELVQMLASALQYAAPAAIRYPRGKGMGVSVPPAWEVELLSLGSEKTQGVTLREGDDAVILSLGARTADAVAAADKLSQENVGEVAVFNARFAKPLPAEQILGLAAKYKRILTLEENSLAGGFGSAVLELLNDNGALGGQKIKRLGLPDHFIEHGPTKELLALVELDQKGIEKALLDILTEG